MIFADTSASGELLAKIKTEIVDFCIKYGLKLIGAVIVLVVGLWVAKLLVKAFTKSKCYNKIEKDARGFVASALRILLYAAVIVTVICILGIPMASVVAVIASCGVAIGLALQGSLSNFAGGLMLLIYKPFHIGDYIVTANHEGTVDDIGLFSTSLVTIDNRRVVLPNASLSNTNLVNNTYFKERMVDLTFCVDCDAPIDTVVSTLYAMAESQPKRLEDKEIICRFSAFGDSCAKYQLRVWCETKDYWELYYALQDGGKRALTEKGIKIPYPIVEVKPSDDRQYQ